MSIATVTFEVSFDITTGSPKLEQQQLDKLKSKLQRTIDSWQLPATYGLTTIEQENN